MDNGNNNLGLKQISLKSEYNTEDDDLIRNLYAPCLSVSDRYDRAVGYFRANIYKELGEDLLNFVIAGGKVRIICSPDIPEPDELAAREGYNNRGHRSLEELYPTLIGVFQAMSRNPDELDCLDMLSLLIEQGSLDLYIAIRIGGIFHRKIGIFFDKFGNMVAFSGSGNETRKAICSIEDWSNDEEFDVYRSWGDGFETSKALKKANYLEALFNGGSKKTKVRLLNEIERTYLNKIRFHSNLEECRRGAKNRCASLNKKQEQDHITKSPYYFQQQAIDAWKSSKGSGIISMATGTGKTITALFAIESLIKEGKPILILVPSKALLDQWHKSIREFYNNVPILLAGGGHNWKSDSKKRMYISNINLPRIILATMGSASKKDFIQFLAQANDPVLVVDEVHRLGSRINRQILEVNFKEKLGLSATPERLFDPEGDAILKKTFGVMPIYDLPLSGKVKISEADDKEFPILGTFLSNYIYDFETIYLQPSEQLEWDKITAKIRKLVAKNVSNKKSKIDELTRTEVLERLFINRARIIKQANGKVACACKIIGERYPSNGKWIVYCDNEKQMDLVFDTLNKNYKNYNILKYYSEMTSNDREMTLKYLEEHPSIVVSIRCLDEGVDIPSIDGALILASSTNPREYIQRRGRVLRKAKGKRDATIIDIIVLPNFNSDDNYTMTIIKSELARAFEFAVLARNQEVAHRLWRLGEKFGVNVSIDSEISFQEDEQEE